MKQRQDKYKTENNYVFATKDNKLNLHYEITKATKFI